jgi:hypothetical protein
MQCVPRIERFSLLTQVLVWGRHGTRQSRLLLHHASQVHRAYGSQGLLGLGLGCSHLLLGMRFKGAITCTVHAQRQQMSTPVDHQRMSVQRH